MDRSNDFLKSNQYKRILASIAGQLLEPIQRTKPTEPPKPVEPVEHL